MATHSSVLAWRSPQTESLEGYSPRGRKETDKMEYMHGHTMNHTKFSGEKKSDTQK